MKKPALYLLLFSVSTMALCQKTIPLYTGVIPGSVQGRNNEAWTRDSSSVSRVSIPALTIFLPENGKETGTAVIICPGGGYRSLVMKREGSDVARELNKIGVAAFVLKYRLPDDTIMKDRSIGPLQDAQQAIKLVRLNSREWKIDPFRVGIMGFSAGGHLASTAGTHFSKAYIENQEHISLRPDFMILVYPVISMKETITHSGSREILLGKSPVPEMVNSFSNELQVTAQTPPAFLIHGRDDSKVPVENSILFFEALKKNNIKSGLHIYASGEHGFPSGEAKSSWLRYCLDWIQAGSWQPEKMQKMNSLSDEEAKAGWKLLFDGTTFKGWTGLGRDHIPSGSWKTEDGTIHKVNTGTMRQLPDGQMVESGDIVTAESFENFELVFDWKILKGENSGVKYNLYNQKSTDGKPSVSALGFEYQLLDDRDESYKSLLPSQYSGSLYEMIAPQNSVLKSPGTFNTSRIVVNGNHAEHWLNGVKVVDYDFGSKELEEGFKKSKFNKYPGFIEKRPSGIVIQNHTEEAWFRNLKIRELKPGTGEIDKSLFNGKDLTGWHWDVPEMDKDTNVPNPFIVRNGMLVSLGTPGGHLITDQIYSNYRLEVEYRFASKTGNCGVLVHASTPRALYKMFPKSVEVQMEHQNAGDFWCICEDISTPDMEARRGPKEEWGITEGRKRRIKNLTDGSEKPAGEWNSMVIECVGRDVKVWVNGDLVNWGHECTAEKGQIALQAEGSEVEFRKLILTQIKELTR
jgi:acetyl esterase/lipase